MAWSSRHPARFPFAIKNVEIGNPQDAIEHGIGMVHQNFMLVDSFTVAQNIILNRETKQGIRIDFPQAVADTQALSAEYGLHVNPNARIDGHSGGYAAAGGRSSKRCIAAPRSSSSMSRPPC